MFGKFRREAMLLLFWTPPPTTLDERQRVFRGSIILAAYCFAVSAFMTYIGFDRYSRGYSRMAIETWLIVVWTLFVAARFTIKAVRARPSSN